MSNLTEKVPTIIATNNSKGIESHKTAAKHHQLAAQHHLEAAKHHEDNSHEKAAISTVKAMGHSSLATDASKENTKHHVA